MTEGASACQYAKSLGTGCSVHAEVKASLSGIDIGQGAAQERKIFDEKFIRLDTRRLCELTSAADALAMKPLVDLTSRALARLIEGKTPEQVRLPPPDNLGAMDWRMI